MGDIIMTFGQPHVTGSMNILLTTGPLLAPFYSRPLVSTVTTVRTGVQDTLPPNGVPSTWNTIKPVGKHYTTGSNIRILTFNSGAYNQTVYVHATTTWFYRGGWTRADFVSGGYVVKGFHAYLNTIVDYTCTSNVAASAPSFSGLEVNFGTNNSVNAFFFNNIYIKCT